MHVHDQRQHEPEPFFVPHQHFKQQQSWMWLILLQIIWDAIICVLRNSGLLPALRLEGSSVQVHTSQELSHFTQIKVK